MTDEQMSQLGRTLWDIAGDLRESMKADDIRDCMLSFLFLLYLSDNYEAAAQKELGKDYPRLPADDKQSPLAVWYQQNATHVEDFENQMRRKVHYVIHPDYLWRNIHKLARTKSKELLRTLENGFKCIENESLNSSFQGLFSEINLNSEELGRTLAERNDKLCTVISKITGGIAKFSTTTDILGDAYEYLIGRFAAASIRTLGEFYTPPNIAAILSRIVTLDSQDPKNGKKRKLNCVLDFACGSGSLLLNVRKEMEPRGIGKIYGQEKNITTYNLARMNMLLHGVKDTEFDIFHGDSLTNDWGMLREMNPTKKFQCDAVVANPPFSYRWTSKEEMSEDFRFRSHGQVPKLAADFAFLLHGFHFLGEEGAMAIILSNGALFRGGRERRIRTKLLDDGHIDTVIGLPSKLFFSTGITVCILVLKKCKKFDDVLFINASEHYEKGKWQKRLVKEHVDKIVGTYQHRKQEERYSRRVSMKEIRENDYNLNISRYVSTAQPEPQVDLGEAREDLAGLEKKIAAHTKKHNKFLEELGLPPLP